MKIRPGGLVAWCPARDPGARGPEDAAANRTAGETAAGQATAADVKSF